ncbi:hypothetical protein [Gallaecimonas pentaromativorans]|uniref:hypothetical protein n=1 Tax=Gallaecimonas pentaromativorans TaxID=584787 RepID=UPI0012ED7F85|nr:hypothetical protein [Gallaecimonas pentaromativorans]
MFTLLLVSALAGGTCTPVNHFGERPQTRQCQPKVEKAAPPAPKNSDKKTQKSTQKKAS